MATQDAAVARTSTSEHQLRREVAGLADDEILALCYAFKGRTERLRLYLDVLRKRGGERAQFSACLICYDLARQGDLLLQQEFMLLASTMAALAQKPAFAASLIGDDPYLSFIWELCQAALEATMQQPLGALPAAADALSQLSDSQAHVPTLDLLTDKDFDDFELSTDARTQRRRFDAAVEQFLGSVPGLPAYDFNAGFRYHAPRAQERIETFLQELNSLRDIVASARGFRTLTLLFLGTHLHSRSLFGTRNSRRQQVIRDGLEEFVAHGDAVSGIAGVLGPMHADDDVWPKIANLLLHYASWLAQSQGEPPRHLAQYEPPV